MENRAKAGRDAAQPDAGLAIWHVDEQGDNSNEHMTAAGHYELSLEQADGLFELERSRNERGDASDLFAGAGACFADDTVPGIKWWDGTATHLAIGSISEIGPTMSFRCTFANVIDTPGGGIIRRESAPGLNIPDNQATGISDTIQIPEAVPIADIKVTVDVSHTYRGDRVASEKQGWGGQRPEGDVRRR